MAGVANDYLIYPIMDLIKAETKRLQQKEQISIRLQEHPQFF